MLQEAKEFAEEDKKAKQQKTSEENDPQLPRYEGHLHGLLGVITIVITYNSILITDFWPIKSFGCSMEIWYSAATHVF